MRRLFPLQVSDQAGEEVHQSVYREIQQDVGTGDDALCRAPAPIPAGPDGRDAGTVAPVVV